MFKSQNWSILVSTAVFAMALAFWGFSQCAGTDCKPEAIVSRMVSTIDALPKQSVGMNVVPLRTPTGRFQVISDDGNFVASPIFLATT